VAVVAVVGTSQRGDGEAVPAQGSGGGAVLTLGCIDDVLSQEAVVGFRVWVISNGRHAATVFGWGTGRADGGSVQRSSGLEG